MIKLETFFAFLMFNNALLRVIELRAYGANEWQVIVYEWVSTVMLYSINRTEQVIILNFLFLNSFVDSGSLIMVSPDAGRLHDSAEVGSF